MVYTKYSKYAIKFDLKSAYHHLEINPEHQNFLGFSWKFGSQVKNFNFKDIFRELQFWYFHCNFLSFKSIVPMYRQPQRVIFTDASQFAGAGFTVGDKVRSVQSYGFITQFLL
jgi:hypothetical protein